MGALSNPAAVDSVTVGGTQLTNLRNLVILYGETTTTGKYSNLVDASGTSQIYLVPVGKTFRCRAIKITSTAATAGLFAYGYDSSAGTNGFNQVAISGTFTQVSSPLIPSGPNIGSVTTLDVNFTIPTGKAPAIAASNTVPSCEHLFYGYYE